jgi:hypothetical protein
VKGLNLVLTICMGSSFGNLAKGWIDVVSEKFFCVATSAKLLCVVDIGS